jgi:hypothetical protein
VIQIELQDYSSHQFFTMERIDSVLAHFDEAGPLKVIWNGLAALVPNFILLYIIIANFNFIYESVEAEFFQTTVMKF